MEPLYTAEEVIEALARHLGLDPYFLGNALQKITDAEERGELCLK